MGHWLLSEGLTQMLRSWLVVSKASRGGFHQQVSPGLFPEEQWGWSPGKKHRCVKSLEVQPHNWLGITLLPTALQSKSQGQPDAKVGAMNSAPSREEQGIFLVRFGNLPQSRSVELGVVNTWMVTDATAVGAVSQGPGYGEKRRGSQGRTWNPKECNDTDCGRAHNTRINRSQSNGRKGGDD